LFFFQTSYRSRGSYYSFLSSFTFRFLRSIINWHASTRVRPTLFRFYEFLCNSLSTHVIITFVQDFARHIIEELFLINNNCTGRSREATADGYIRSNYWIQHLSHTPIPLFYKKRNDYITCEYKIKFHNIILFDITLEHWNFAICDKISFCFFAFILNAFPVCRLYYIN